MIILNTQFLEDTVQVDIKSVGIYDQNSMCSLRCEILRRLDVPLDCNGADALECPFVPYQHPALCLTLNVPVREYF